MKLLSGPPYHYMGATFKIKVCEKEEEFCEPNLGVHLRGLFTDFGLVQKSCGFLSPQGRLS